MSESKDSAIKLFGRTIKLPEIPSGSGLDSSTTARSAAGVDCILRHRSCSPSFLAQRSDLTGDDGANKPDSLKGIKEGDGVEVLSVDPSGIKDNPKALSPEEQTVSSESQERTLKKPDNLIPCPRCNSLETKFCYYNNYNVSQPRHFCKNCHRYWTAGGTIRNVAVGAGRRKKNLASQCRQLTILEAPQNGHEEVATNAIIHPVLNPNTALLSSCESIASVLNIADKSVLDPKNNGYPLVPPHTAAYCPAGFSLPFFPPPVAAPYAGCSMPPGSWSVPWLNSLPKSDHNSPTLGKHSRDVEDCLMKRANPENDEPLKRNTEKSPWVPKTLRVVDPEEATAKSSIWPTIGIKDDKVDSANGGGRLKAFHSNGDNKFKLVEPSTLLQANPSALSRSLSFQESSSGRS